MKVSPKHWEVFLDYAEKYPQIITGKFQSLNGKQEQQKMWTKISEKLNALGMGEKSAQKWKAAVIDWKSKTKTKAAQIKSHITKTGGGGPAKKLSEIEERLLALIGWTAVHGDASLEEVGIENSGTEETSENINEGEVFYVFDEEDNVNVNVRKRTRRNDERNMTIEKYQSQTMSKLDAINEAINKNTDALLAIKDVLQDISSFHVKGRNIL